MIGKDAHHMIENAQVTKMQDTDYFYLQFSIASLDPSTSKLCRITGFRNLELIEILKEKSRLHFSNSAASL